MEHIETIAERNSIKPFLRRVGDLAYYEGPILTLYQHLTTHSFYLFDWVDHNETTNRWLVYEVSANHLLRYIGGTLSHRDLFTADVYRIADIQAGNIQNYDLRFLVSGLPENYLPREDAMFDDSGIMNLQGIRQVIRSMAASLRFANRFADSNRLSAERIFHGEPVNQWRQDPIPKSMFIARTQREAMDLARGIARESATVRGTNNEKQSQRNPYQKERRYA